MTNYSEKICEACQPDADPATNEEIIEFLSNSPAWSLIQSDKAKKLKEFTNSKILEMRLSLLILLGR